MPLRDNSPADLPKADQSNDDFASRALSQDANPFAET